MTQPFRPLPAAEPDAIDLELLHLGALTDAPTANRVKAAAAGTLASEDAELTTYRSFWAAHRPPLPLPSATPRWRRPWVGGVALAAAALLVAVALLGGLRDDGVRAMGALPVDVTASRAGAPSDPGDVRAGDQLRIAFVAPVSGFVDVATVESNGRVSVLATGQPVRAGERFALAGAVRLDDTDQREWLVVDLVEHARSEQAARRAMGTLLPDPEATASNRRWVMEVTRTP